MRLKKKNDMGLMGCIIVSYQYNWNSLHNCGWADDLSTHIAQSGTDGMNVLFNYITGSSLWVEWFSNSKGLIINYRCLYLFFGSCICIMYIYDIVCMKRKVVWGWHHRFFTSVFSVFFTRILAFYNEEFIYGTM